MKVTLNNIKVKDLFAGFKEDFTTDQVTGYGGRLDIRPKFQREFVSEIQRLRSACASMSGILSWTGAMEALAPVVRITYRITSS